MERSESWMWPDSKYYEISISELRICTEPKDVSNVASRNIFPQEQFRNLNCCSGMLSNILLLFQIRTCSDIQMKQEKGETHGQVGSLHRTYGVCGCARAEHRAHLCLLLPPSKEHLSANINQGLSNGPRTEILKSVAYLGLERNLLMGWT